MNSNTILLGVNIDHVATLRQARGTIYPSVMDAARIAEESGADAITIHLREDRRHIQDIDVVNLSNHLQTRMNLEMAVTAEMIKIAKEIKPKDCCLVPEKREELTTEGGLDVVGNFDKIKAACDQLSSAGIRVSLFIDADADQITAAHRCGAPVIEIHTGHYADATTEDERRQELARIIESTKLGTNLGLQVNAGHGLNLSNVRKIAQIADIRELNIGHAIVADAVFNGLGSAVRRMKDAMLHSR